MIKDEKYPITGKKILDERFSKSLEDAKNGDVDGMIDVAYIYESAGDLEKAIEWLEKASQESLTGLEALRDFYYVHRNDEKAHEVHAEFVKQKNMLFEEGKANCEKLAKTGDARAMYDMYDRYYCGVEWCEKAAKNGCLDAMIKFAFLLESRNDVPKSEYWYEQAANAILSGVEINDSDPLESLYFHYECKDEDKAIIFAKKACYYLGAEYAIIVGDYYLRRDNLVDAAKWYKKGIDCGYKEDVNACKYALGNIYSRQGCFDEAISYYEGTDKYYIGEVFEKICGIYREQGDVAKAIEWYDQKIAKSAEFFNLGVFEKICEIYREQGDETKAIEWYDQTLSKSFECFSEDVFEKICEIYREQGNEIKAVEWYYKLIGIYERDIASGDDSAIKKLFEFHLRHCEIDKAIASCDKAIQYTPVAAMLCLGDFYYKRDEVTKALEWYQKALSYEENIKHNISTKVINRFVDVYIKQGNPDGAVCFLEKYKECKNARAYGKIKRAYYKQGNHDKLIGLREKLL